MAKLVELDRSTVGRNVKLLQRMGLVQVNAGTDQREATVMLDEPGRDVLQRGAPLWDEAQRRIEATLGPTAEQLRNSASIALSSSA